MIKVENISKSFGQTVAVDNVSFELTHGDSLLIVGPSGSGKTTLLRLIAGLEIPDGGTVQIDGKIASNDKWAIEPNRRGIGYVFQSPALWPHMTVSQNITFGINPTGAKKRASELLDKLGLEGFEDRKPDEISRGEARRVSIARTLAPCPKRLLMDEALTNIDAELKERVMGVILEEVSESGASMIFVTHDRDEVDRIMGAKLELRNGRIG